MRSNGKSITESMINYELWDRFLTILVKESDKKESSAPLDREGQDSKEPAKAKSSKEMFYAYEKNIPRDK